MNGTHAFHRAVVLRTDKIGDLLVSTPALRNLRTALPRAHITLVTSRLCADVLNGWDAIDAIEVFDARESRASRADVARRLRCARPDVVFALTPQSSIYRLAGRIAAPVRVGFGYRSRPLDFALARLTLTHPVFTRVPEAIERAHEVPHHADELLALLHALDLPATRCPMEVPVGDADRAWAHTLLAGESTAPSPIVLHLSHKWLHDGWGRDDVIALVEGLRSIDDGRNVLITVGPEDGRVWEAVRGVLPAPTARRDVPGPPAAASRMVVVEHPSFGRWAALIASSALVVSPDTGAIHLGSATGRPVVGVYAQHRYHVFSRQWGPWMVPCRTLPKARGVAGVRAITDAAASLLDEVAPRGLGA